MKKETDKVISMYLFLCVCEELSPKWFESDWKNLGSPFHLSQRFGTWTFWSKEREGPGTVTDWQSREDEKNLRIQVEMSQV